MEPFRVHILGCGSALPTLRHFASSQVVEMRGKLFNGFLKTLFLMGFFSRF